MVKSKLPGEDGDRICFAGRYFRGSVGKELRSKLQRLWDDVEAAEQELRARDTAVGSRCDATELQAGGDDVVADPAAAPGAPVNVFDVSVELARKIDRLILESMDVTCARSRRAPSARRAANIDDGIMRKG